MQNLVLTEPNPLSVNPTPSVTECWYDDDCILDMDNFIKALSCIKGKEVLPDLIGSIITHYAAKWLPDLVTDDTERAIARFEESPRSITASWMKKRFFIETLIGVLPPVKDSLPCNFMLRLLRFANMVGVDSDHCAELEKRVSWQLDQASLKDLMIPSFSHTSTTLLDMALVIRLVKSFLGLEEVARSGAALSKVAKLVDGYLAEAAVDSHLTLSKFITLAAALPVHARSLDDGLYRAIDTYLKRARGRDYSCEQRPKAHPGMSKEDRKRLCNLIDNRKLSPEASFHAAQNERLPVRAVIQVLLSEQNKLHKQVEWSGSLSCTRSPGIVGLEGPGRCLSKREVSIQQLEIKRLKEDVLRLQSQCMNMERQIEKLLEKKKGYFSWKKLVFKGINVKTGGIEGEPDAMIGLRTPLEMKARLVRGRKTAQWRKSLS